MSVPCVSVRLRGSSLRQDRKQEEGMTTLKGRCLCGAVTWSSAGPVTRNLVCHCESCQRATSSPFTAFVGLPSDRVAWVGEITHFESSPDTYRGFCPTCGSRLYFRSDRWPEETHIHAATLVDQSSYRPDAQVLLAERVSWLDHLDAAERCEGFHKTPQVTR
jgi:hypothetical protein